MPPEHSFTSNVGALVRVCYRCPKWLSTSGGLMSYKVACGVVSLLIILPSGVDYEEWDYGGTSSSFCLWVLDYD